MAWDDVAPDQYEKKKKWDEIAPEEHEAPDKTQSAFMKAGARMGGLPGLAMGAMAGSMAKPFMSGDDSRGFLDKAKESVGNAYDTLGREADYIGGHLRTGLAEGYGLLTGNKITNDEDVQKALVGKAPSASEFYERAGLPEGPSVPNPLTGNKVSARDALGFLSDVASDPMGGAITAESKALSKTGAAMAEKPGLLNKLSNSIGEKIYGSGFKKIDERLAEKGKTPIKDVLLSEGAPAGTTKQVAKQMDNIATRVAGDRSAIYSQVDKAVGPIDMTKQSFDKAQSTIDALKNSRYSHDQELADTLQKHLNETRSRPTSIGELSDLKTDLYNKLPPGAFDGDKGLKSAAQKYNKALSQDLRQVIIGHADSAEKGLGKKIDQLNDKWSSLITAENPTAMQIRRGETKNAITPFDAALGVFHPGIEVAKKAAELGNLTYTRTHLGKGLMDVASQDVPDAIARRGLINSNRTDVPVPFDPYPVQELRLTKREKKNKEDNK